MTDDLRSEQAAVLLAAYDEQLRGGSESADVPTSTDGPVIRVEYPSRGFVSYRSLEDLDGAELDALIARQRDYFAAKGQSVEWKTRGHDLPADLPERLIAAGFEPEERETVVIAESADIVERLRGRESVDGVTIRRTGEEADFARIAAMESTVWDADWSWLTDDLVRRHATGLPARWNSGTAISRWTPRTTAPRSCSGWDSSPSPRPRPTSSRPRAEPRGVRS